MIAPAAARIRIADTSFGVLGAALLMCAFAFATFGIPPMPPALLVVAGLPSPLTGMTRSFVALAGGDLAHAFALHPLGPLCFLACVIAIASLVVARRTESRPALVDRIVRIPYAPWIVAGAFLVTWVRQAVVFR